MKKVSLIFDLLDVIREQYPGKEDVFGFKAEGKWHKVSGDDYFNYSELVSYGLLAAGMQSGDKVATILNNKPEWNFLDMGILQSGCIHVPLYPTLSTGNYRFIFDDADIKLVIVGCRDAYERVKPLLNTAHPDIVFYSIEEIEGVPNWRSLLESGRNSRKLFDLEQIKTSITEERLATIIYTSGTTGRPKGVMLSHANMVSNFISVSTILDKIKVTRALSFLPLCHVYERMLNYMYQYLGISVYYAENIDRIRDNLREVRPEMFCAVPRVIEKSYAAILRKGRNLNWLQKPVFFWALNLGHRFEIEKISRPVFRLKLKVADLLVYRKWRLAFGNNIRFIVSGGAPLNPKLARIFWAAGMQVIEGYGLTETSPVIATGNFEPGGFKFGTVGPVLKGVAVKLLADGEILCKGPNVMMGYYKRPELTAEVLDDEGWFHTGDIGEIVDNIYLKITDRKKEIFKTSGGKYIAPQVVENKLKESPFIENILVVGENRNFPSALIVPNFEYLKSWCNDKGIDYTTDSEMVKSAEIVGRIAREVDAYNQDIDRPSQIRKFVIMNKPWAVETGELSFTMKVRRTHLQECFAAVISDIYSRDAASLQGKRERKTKKEKKKKKQKIR